jgi:hypothetical protein
VTWQEELRKLDESLASGNLSADEYRTRRDQILSSAVSSPEQAETSEPSNADSTQVIAPLSSSQQQSGQQPAPEATQVVSPSDVGAERTQAVSPWQMQQMQQQQQQGGQAYPASPPGGFQQPTASPPGGFAQPQGQPWNAAQEDSSPPWGGGDFPPLTPQGSQEWGVSQGPESFDDTESTGKGRKVLLSVVAALLVAGIGVAVYFLFISGDSSNNAGPANPSQSQQQPPPPVTPTSTPLPKPPPPKEEPPDNDAALIDPPGKERPGSGPFDYKFLEKNGDMLPQTVVDALGDADMDDGLLKSTIDDDITIGLYAIEVGSEDDAVAVATEYGMAQQEGGIPAERELSMQGVQVFAAGASGDSVFRAVYVLYDRVIIVDVFGEGRKNVEPVFSELLEQQVNHAPPTYTQS